jgi:glycosyltransferase involved in cell wall biosynthesis
VHTRTIRADLVGRVGAAIRVPVINNIVNIYPDDCLVRLGPVFGRGAMILSRWTARAARLFVANANAVAENTSSAFDVPRDRVRVVYDGVDIARWQGAPPADLRSHGVANDDRVCLTVTRLHPQKGVHDLVKAAAMVVADDPDVRFVVAGDGPERVPISEAIRAAGLQRNVVLLGNRDDIPSLLARARLFVLPSRFEGLPSAIIEAMAAGRSVVASSTAGVPELVDDGVTGWLVPPQAPREMARAILHALSNDLRAMERAGRQRAERRFSALAMTRGFADVYEAALSA